MSKNTKNNDERLDELSADFEAALTAYQKLQTAVTEHFEAVKKAKDVEDLERQWQVVYELKSLIEKLERYVLDGAATLRAIAEIRTAESNRLLAEATERQTEAMGDSVRVSEITDKVDAALEQNQKFMLGIAHASNNAMLKTLAEQGATKVYQNNTDMGGVSDVHNLTATGNIKEER